MARVSTLIKFKDRFWDDIESLEATAIEREQILRLRFIFDQKLQNPSVENRTLIEELENKFKISQSQAYRDIADMDEVFGDIQSSSKEYIRYIVNETLKEAIALARDRNDAKSMVAAASALAKYARLDQPDTPKLPFDKIIPQTIEYTADPSVLGIEIKGDPQQLIAAAKRKYLNAQEVEYEDVKK